MNLKTFWDLVERSKAAATKKKDHAETLVEMLAELDVEGIVGFARHLFNRMSEAYRNDLWVACYLLSGGYASDDGFKDFRSYLISRGRADFAAALRDPDCLAERIPPDEDPGYEVFADTASNAYNRKTGSWFDVDGIDERIRPKGFMMWEMTKPAGEPLTVADAGTHLPKLKKRFDETMQRCLAEAKEAYRSGDPPKRLGEVWEFYHFAPHSPDAFAMLEAAAKDKSKKVREQAMKYLEYLRRNAKGR
jgi:Protein of unknown function (DUF4240)